MVKTLEKENKEYKLEENNNKNWVSVSFLVELLIKKGIITEQDIINAANTS